MVIYKATNNITGESYIGYTTKGLEGREGRKSRHKGSADREDGFYFQRAIKKYGWNNFRWFLLESNITDFTLLKQLEIYWIKEFDTKYPNGYNLTNGGDGTLGFHHTKESKRKMSEAKKGKITWMKGKKHTEESKRKMGESHKGCIPWNKGRKGSTNE